MTPRGYLVRARTDGRVLSSGISWAAATWRTGVDVTVGANLAQLPLGPGGLLLGTLFRKSDSSRITTMSERSDDRAADLLDRHWGGYVALWQDGHGIRVLRDPSGSLPCYYVERPGEILLASDLTALRVEGWVARPDLDAVARQFLDGQLQRATTCVEGVRELLPGMMLEITETGARSMQLWRGAKFAAAASASDLMDEARTRVRRVIEDCTGAWRGCFRAPMVEMSGGLDSSIVAACLGETVFGIPALNLVTPGRDGDERRYARDIADHVGACLTEGQRDPDRIDLSLAIAPYLPRPGVRGFTQESDRLITTLADAVGADAIFSGGGGDSVFCALPSALAAVDALQSAGLGRFFDTLRDAAECSNRTIWWALRRVLRGARARPGARACPHRAELLATDFRVPPVDIQHPWLDGAETLPRGRREHIAMVAGILGHLHGMGRAQRRPMIFPLMAQPVIETCLAIPSWLWVEDGIDRAVARRAFADRLPASVAFRRTKGHLDVFGRMVFDQHRLVIREMLLGGALAAGGVLDCAVIERTLAGDPPIHTINHFDFLELVDMEAWIQGVSSAWR